MIITEQVGGGRILTDGKYLLGRVYPPLPGGGVVDDSDFQSDIDRFDLDWKWGR